MSLEPCVTNKLQHFSSNTCIWTNYLILLTVIQIIFFCIVSSDCFAATKKQLLFFWIVKFLSISTFLVLACHWVVSIFYSIIGKESFNYSGVAPSLYNYIYLLIVNWTLWPMTMVIAFNNIAKCNLHLNF